jgi:hypothetical protein
LRLVPSLVAAFTACLLADGFWYRVGRRGWSTNHRFCGPKSNWKNRVLSLIWRHSGAAMLFKVRCWLECGFATGWSSRAIGSTVSQIGTAADEGDGRSLLVFEHSENAYALEKLKSDADDWVFRTRVPVHAMESRSASSQVEVALNR